jgi:hypothetical protein
MAASLQLTIALASLMLALGFKQSFPVIQRPATADQPSSANCTEIWFTQVSHRSVFQTSSNLSDS